MNSTLLFPLPPLEDERDQSEKCWGVGGGEGAGREMGWVPSRASMKWPHSSQL